MKDQNAQYNPYEARLIQLLRWRFEQARLKTEDQLTVGTLPLKIDLIVSAENADEAKPALPPLFEYFKRHNVMEIKTEGDRLEPEDLLQLQAYGYMYMAKKHYYSVGEIAIAHHLTPSLLNALPDLKYAPVAPGVFKCDAPLVSYVFALEDLQDELVPEELQIFSNAKRRQRVFLSNFENREKKPLLETIVDLYNNEAIILMEQLGIRPESMRSFIEALGVEKISSILSKEEHLKALSKEEIVSALSKEEIISALSKEEMISALSKEEMIAAMGGKESLLKMLLADTKLEEAQKLLAQSRLN